MDYEEAMKRYVEGRCRINTISDEKERSDEAIKFLNSFTFDELKAIVRCSIL